jgi:hypothetical protein
MNKKERSIHLDQLKAIRAFCALCADTARETPIKCDMVDCPLFYYRTKRPARTDKLRGRITEKCHECAVMDEIACNYDGKRNDFCPLWPFRPNSRHFKRRLKIFGDTKPLHENPIKKKTQQNTLKIKNISFV